MPTLITRPDGSQVYRTSQGARRCYKTVEDALEYDRGFNDAGADRFVEPTLDRPCRGAYLEGRDDYEAAVERAYLEGRDDYEAAVERAQQARDDERFERMYERAYGGEGYLEVDR